jgi:LytS/YehU family sensor histidine kinase
VRRTAEVRLQAAQGRVDPRLLFDALAAVERVRNTEPAMGFRLLDNLVAYLRAVMPKLQDTRSTIGQELDIARSWLDIRQAVARSPARYAIEDVPTPVLARRFPCMMIVPLASAMLAEAPAFTRFFIGVGAEEGMTTMHLRCDATASADPGGSPVLQELRMRLAQLYGTSVRLSCVSDAFGCLATVEVDLD